MDNKYKKTMEKIAVDDAFKRDLKKSLKISKKKYSPLVLRYASFVLMIAAGFLIYFINRPVFPTADTQYVINLEHAYYKGIEAYAEPVQEYESYLLDFSSLHKDNIYQIEEITSYVKDNTVYSTLQGSSIVTQKTISFEVYGGTIPKKMWDEAFDFELTDYDKQSHIKIMNDKNFNLDSDELFYVEVNEEYGDIIYKARYKDSQYEVFIDLINEWVLIQ